MENDIQAGGTAESISPGTKELMDDLRKEGYSFEGDKPVDPPKEEPKPEPEKEKVEEKKEDLQKEEEEEKKSEKVSERKPREIPAWKVEMNKRREEKAQAEEKDALNKRIDQIEAGINNLIKTITEKSILNPSEQENLEQEVEDLSDKLEKGEITIKEYTKKLISLSTKSVPKSEKAEIADDIKAKLSQLDELSRKSQVEKEEREFSEEFDKSVISAIKKDYPSVSEEDLNAIKGKIRDYYFDKRYITLSPLEIYTLKKGEMENEVSPDAKKSIENSKPGVGRDTKVIDYGNISEDEFKKLPPDEQQKVMDYRIAKEREAKGVRVND